MLLVIDTATDACSVALFDGEERVEYRHEIIGRGHAERLVPMIAELPDNGRADQILVDCGPGSFTGLRVGIATARGLGLGWGAEVFGYSSLSLMAAMHFANPESPDTVAVTIFGGHGEMFIQRFQKSPFMELAPLASLKPEAALAVIEEPVMIGNAATELASLHGTAKADDSTPRAADMLLLPESFRNLSPSPIYGRAPDAKPPQSISQSATE